MDLLAGQGVLKSLLQHHGSKASILWCSAFSMVLLSHPYMTTGKFRLMLCKAPKTQEEALTFSLSKGTQSVYPRMDHHRTEQWYELGTRTGRTLQSLSAAVCLCPIVMAWSSKQLFTNVRFPIFRSVAFLPFEVPNHYCHYPVFS